jgi:hypothetical protein
MKITIPVVIDMSPEQVAEFGQCHGLGRRPRARDVVELIRSEVLAHLRGYNSEITEFGDVSLKGGTP